MMIGELLALALPIAPQMHKYHFVLYNSTLITFDIIIIKTSIDTFDMMEQSRSQGIPVASSGARRNTQSRGRVKEYSWES